MLLNKKGFTIIELIVVIAIIAVLASIILVSVNQYQAKARDAKRVADMNQILKALNIYQATYGCIPITYGTTCPGAGGYSDYNSGSWDYSSQPTATPAFMSFLVSSGIMSKVPVDPINNMTGDSSPSGTYAYKYYCYDTGLHLGYFKESGGWSEKTYNVINSGGWTDNTFICK